MTTGRAIMIGVGIAIVMIAVVLGLALTGVVGGLSRTSVPVEGPVIVALVLPNESGVQEPRVLDVYTRGPSGWTVASVSPSLPVVVSGTTGSTLSDAYVYGGGAALAKAYSALGRGEAASWVVVDPAAWSLVSATKAVTVDLPSPLEVFDGTQLMSLPAGRSSILSTQTALFLIGAQYLPTAQNAAVRAQVGDSLGEILSTASASGMAGLKSDLREAQLSRWLGTLEPLTRTNGD